MDLELIVILFISCIFALLCIYEDIKYRKISNYLNLSFFIFAFAYFTSKLFLLNLIDFIMIFIIILISFFLHYKKIWGAADGKVFISISLILISLKGLFLVLDFLINLALFYSFVIIFLTIFKTSIKEKWKAFKRIKFGEIIFTILIAFIITTIFLKLDISIFEGYTLFFILLFVLIFMLVTKNYIRKLYNLLDSEIKLLSSLILFLLLGLFAGIKFIGFFITIFCFKIILDFISRLSSRIAASGKESKYYSPFSIYLFLICILTMILEKNIIKIILLFVQ